MSASYSLRFRLALSSEKYLAYYQGAAKNIVARTEDGRNIQFPANAIRRFLQHEGIYGLFEISFNEKNKLLGINRIAD